MHAAMNKRDKQGNEPRKSCKIKIYSVEYMHLRLFCNVSGAMMQELCMIKIFNVNFILQSFA